MSVRHITEINKEDIPAAKNATRQVLISSNEGPNFAMRRFIIDVEGFMPEHTNSVEHEQYVIRGRAKIGIGDNVYEVTKGSAVFIPEGAPHWYKNISDEPFEFICVVPNKEDILKFTEKTGS